MRSLWRWLDANGFDWISAWDHLYEAPPADGTVPHYEAVATLAALAVETTNARLGCLVFYVGYRNPGLLARAAVTIDHLSHGRFELGLGGGWHVWEAEAFGYDFPSIGTRLDMLEEAVELIDGLLNNPSQPEGKNGPGEPARTSFDGEHYKLNNASCLPPPINGHMPLWIGGVGEKRTLPMVARWATGWNAAYVSAEEFGRLGSILDASCDKIGRDPSEIERSVNLVFGMGVDSSSGKRRRAELAEQWGPMFPRIEGGALLGGPEEVIDQVGQYKENGADMINIALRAPIDLEALAAYQELVIAADR